MIGSSFAGGNVHSAVRDDCLDSVHPLEIPMSYICRKEEERYELKTIEIRPLFLGKGE